MLRQEGLRSLWFKVLGEVCYRRLAIIENIFDGEARPGPPVEWELSKLSISELPAYHAYHPGANLDELRGRLERGGCCFVMRHDGRIIHTCWIVKGTERIEYLDCEVRIGPDLGYAYEAFTVPEFRGRGVAAARTRLMETDLVAAGYRGIVATVHLDNPAALRFNFRAGYRVIGTVGFFRLGPWRRYFLRIDKTLRPAANSGSITLVPR